MEEFYPFIYHKKDKEDSEFIPLYVEIEYPNIEQEPKKEEQNPGVIIIEL